LLHRAGRRRRRSSKRSAIASSLVRNLVRTAQVRIPSSPRSRYNSFGHSSVGGSTKFVNPDIQGKNIK
jgi:hypothetical protein